MRKQIIAGLAWVLVCCGAPPTSWAATSMCVVAFGISETTSAVGSAQFTVDYSNVQGTFDQDTNGHHCRSAVTGMHVFTGTTCLGLYEECQWGERRELAVAVTADAEVAPDSDVIFCHFLTDSEIGREDFKVRLDGAAQATKPEALRQIPPQIQVRSVECHEVARSGHEH